MARRSPAPPPARSEAVGGGAPSPRRPHLLLVACILASSLAFVDGSVVNVSLSAIGRSLHAGAAELQWVVNAYLLPLSALLLLGGAAGDRFGRRPLLLAGIAIFLMASVGCAWAPDLPWLVAARAAQGVGAALVLPNSLATLGATFSGEARGRAVGTWSAAGAVFGAIGPVLGGWLVDRFGWRAVFLINLPLGLSALALAAAAVRDRRSDGERAALDGAGALLATACLGALTAGLTLMSGRRGWSPGGGLALLAGAVAGWLFLRVEARRGERAMAPLQLFGSRGFIGLTLLTFLLYGALGGLLVLLPYVLIQAAGYSALGAGAALLPFPVVLSIMSPVMGGLAGRVGPRLPLSAGPVIAGGGFLLLAGLTPGRSYWTGVLRRCW